MSSSVSSSSTRRPQRVQPLQLPGLAPALPQHVSRQLPGSLRSSMARKEFANRTAEQHRLQQLENDRRLQDIAELHRAAEDRLHDEYLTSTEEDAITLLYGSAHRELNTSTPGSAPLQAADLETARRRPREETDERFERDARNALDLQQAPVQLQRKRLRARETNTKLQYNPKQKIFLTWCDRRVWADGYLVTEAKILVFLREEVEAKGNLKSKNKDGTVKEIDPETYQAYVKAVVDLYQQQFELGTNKHPHPRGSSIKAFLDLKKRMKDRVARQQFRDRGIGTFVDGYTPHELRAVTTYFMQRNTMADLRNSCDFTVGHHMMLRGGSKRGWQLPDLFSVTLENEGPTPCWALVIVSRNGKTNKYGKIEYNAVIRNRKVEVCPLSAMAMYLFARFHLGDETFPDFTNNANWYNYYVLRACGRGRRRRAAPEDRDEDDEENGGADVVVGDDDDESEEAESGGNESMDIRECQLSYTTQYRSVKQAFEKCGISSSRVTHSNRSSGAAMAEANGCDETQIRRMAHWGTTTMEGCYLTTLPLKAMRSMAGFNPDGGAYYLPRAGVVPPEGLASQIFPDAEEWLEKNQSKDITPDLAGQNFLKLLVRLREVILQDSVLLREVYPDHFVFRHPIFQSEEYKSFAIDLRSIVDSSEEHQSADSLLKRLLPALADRLDAGFGDLRGQMAEMSAKLVSVETSAKSDQRENRAQTRLLHQSLTNTFNILAKAFAASATNSESMMASSGVSSDDGFIEEESNDNVPVNELVAAASAEMAALNPETSEPGQVARLDPNVVYVYKQARDLTTVEALWREYRYGLNGHPPVRELERVYKRKWRSSESDKRFFLRRKHIYDEIERLEQNGMVEGEAVLAVESARTSEGRSLDKLWKFLADQKRNQA